MDLHIESVDLSQMEFTSQLLSSVPAVIAHRYEAFPVFRHGAALVIAMSPERVKDLELIDALYQELRTAQLGIESLEIRVASSEDLRSHIREHYGSNEDYI